jgi:hypothetical protein
MADKKKPNDQGPEYYTQIRNGKKVRVKNGNRAKPKPARTKKGKELRGTKHVQGPPASLRAPIEVSQKDIMHLMSNNERNNLQKGSGRIPHGETSDIPRQQERAEAPTVDTILNDPTASSGENEASRQRTRRSLTERERKAADAWGEYYTSAFNNQNSQIPQDVREQHAEQLAHSRVARHSEFAFLYRDGSGTMADRPVTPGLITAVNKKRIAVARNETGAQRFGDAAQGIVGSRETAAMDERGTLHNGARIPENQVISTMLHPADVTSREYGDTLRGLPAQEKRMLIGRGLLNAEGHPVSQDGVAYLNARRITNSSPQETLAWLDSGKPAMKRFAHVKEASFGRRHQKAAISAAVQEHVERTRQGPEELDGIKDKYSTSDPRSHEEFGYGLRGAAVPDLEELRKKHSNATDSELIAFRQEARETIQNHMTDQRAAYETRQARVKGLGTGQNNEQSDERVVVFTTNLGYPTASIAADSLVGQYVIHKRKQMVVKDKYTTPGRKDVKGKFPMAVRDQHLIEGGIGVSAGVEGRGGLFQETGWKFMSHRSKGYANKVPLGAQVLRDKTGLPIYDKHGNVRYTEGYTKRFSAGTDNQVGVRFFVG